MSTLREQAIELLNEAKLCKKDEILNKLAQVQEIVLHREQQLQGELIPSIADFQLSLHAPVRKFVVSFVESVAKQIPTREFSNKPSFKLRLTISFANCVIRSAATYTRD
jgi:hypothetical protein